MSDLHALASYLSDRLLTTTAASVALSCDHDPEGGFVWTAKLDDIEVGFHAQGQGCTADAALLDLNGRVGAVFG